MLKLKMLSILFKQNYSKF